MELDFDTNVTYTIALLNVTLGNVSLTHGTDVLATASPKGVGKVPAWYDSGRVQIPLYSVIFLLAVIGNALVILTLVHNQRMRTITNVFLLNLAVSDLLLGVLCMPFTLVGTLLRDFIFGEIMCKFLPYLQASSVSVSAWTLVAISVERYYAICHPLRSRRWQTLSHSYRLIVAIWGLSLLCMVPIAALSQLIPTNKGHHKCREGWPSIDYERAYNLFLDVILLVVPLVVLAATYWLITRTLWQGMRTEQALKNHHQSFGVSGATFNGTATATNGCVEVYVSAARGGAGSTRCTVTRGPDGAEDSCVPANRRRHATLRWCQLRRQSSAAAHRAPPPLPLPQLRRSNAEKSLINKKRVIQMLFVVVLEFFVCWTPLYVINTIALFNPQAVYNGLGYTAISFFQLLAYSSSCCNPITYCFMNCGFRKSFLNLFRCFQSMHEPRSTRSQRTQLSEFESKCSQMPQPPAAIITRISNR